MKKEKGTLRTSSSLPAGDTEIHHHSMLRRAEFPYPPLGVPRKGHLAYGQHKGYVHKAGEPLARVYSGGTWLRAQCKLGLGHGIKWTRPLA